MTATDLDVIERPTDLRAGPLADAWRDAIEAFGIRADAVDYTSPVTITFNDDTETVTLDCDTGTVHAAVTRQAIVVATALGLGNP